MRFRAIVLNASALVAFNLSAQNVDEGAKRQTARKLVDAIGIREQLQQKMESVLDAATAQLAAAQPDGSRCDNEFVTEWRKRFREQMSAERVIEVIVPIYEKHFTAEELDQLTTLSVAAKQGKPQQPSKQLLEKLQKEAIEVQSETIGATTQLGAKIGGEVGQQISTEHPDWCTRDR